MPTRSNTTTHRLDSSHFVHVDGRQGTELLCLEGLLWVTQDGSAVDIQLAAGQRHVVSIAARLVVCGFGPGTLQVTRQPSASPTSKLGHALGHLVSLRRFATAEPTAIVA